MDKEKAERDLVRVERHVRQGKLQISRQREIVAGLQRGGHDTIQAKELLAQFEKIQALHVQHRDRLRRGLDASAGGRNEQKGAR